MTSKDVAERPHHDKLRYAHKCPHLGKKRRLIRTMLTADDVVLNVAQGVRNALNASRQLLGAEAIDFEHPRIHPEYLITVEVAKCLSGPERVVAMETHMDDLRLNAKRMALFKARLTHRSSEKTAYQQRADEIERVLLDPAFQFGSVEQGSGKKRVDIAVFRSEPREAPLLIAEAKLGRQSPDAIIDDVDRVIRLLRLHKELDFEGPLYGAVFFYRMLKGGSLTGVQGRARGLLSKIDAHLRSEQAKFNQTWLKARAGLLTRGAFHEGVQAYEDLHPDGSTEEIFARRGFAFAPGLVLLGSSNDVESVAL